MVQQDLYFRRRARRKALKFFWFFCFLTIFARLGYFLAFSKYFLIKNVQVQTEDSDKQQIAEFVWQELENKKFGIILGNNVLFLNKNKLISTLLEKYALYKAFEIDYRFKDRTLTISGETRKSVAVACRNDNCSSIDENGIAFSPIESYIVFGHLSPTGVLLFVVGEGVEKEIVFGQQFLPKELIAFASKFKEMANETVPMGSAVIEKEYLEAHFIKFNTVSDYSTGNSWYVLTLFDLDPKSVVENMNLVLEKEVKDNQNRLEYIDLRYRDKAYYKLR